MKLNRFNMLISAVLFIIFKPIEADSSYIIPQPIIRVFRPRGFEVSIPYVEGIQEFRFSANRNEPLPNFSDPRQIQFSRSAFEPDPSGRMSVQDRVARFRRADRFYYQIMVVKDDQYYHSEKEIFSVESKDIFRQPHANSAGSEGDENNHHDKFLSKHDGDSCGIHVHFHVNQDPDTANKSASTTSQSPPLTLGSTSTQPVTEIATDLNNCTAKVYSLVQKISSLQAEVDKLSAEHTMLYSIVNKLPYGRNFKLSGKISASDDPKTVVKFVLSEKLGIKPEIDTAIRKDDSILFSVESLDIALQILRKVEEKLNGSKSFQITNYRDN